MCRAIDEPGGPRRCPASLSAAGARRRKALSRARAALRAAEAGGNEADIATARAKLEGLGAHTATTSSAPATDSIRGQQQR